jgi:demethoxyubiquinone hydroxylase (CLK1/Coq7/Cat5 family)
MKGINEFKVDELKHWDTTIMTDDGWQSARPIGLGGIRRRLAKAWKVFTGKADVLVWHNQ